MHEFQKLFHGWNFDLEILTMALQIVANWLLNNDVKKNLIFLCGGVGYMHMHVSQSAILYIKLS